MIYPIYKNHNKLTPVQSYLTDESVGVYEFYLTDEFISENKYYRLHSKKSMRMADTLEFDIKCPKCNHDLKLCDMAISSTELGLYKCESCNKN